MRFINYYHSEFSSYLSVINDDWPFTFLQGYSDFQKNYYGEEIHIVLDEETGAMMPVRFLNLKLFSPAQILFAPVKNGVELESHEQAQFYRKFIQALTLRGNCERIAQPSTNCVLSAVPQDATYCDFGSYIVDLENQTEEEIFKKFHPKYQKAVNHSLNNEAGVRFGKETLPDFFTTYEQTMKRVNMSYDKYDYFEQLYRDLGNNHLCCGVVYENNQPVSGIFLVYTRYSAFLTHAGTISGSKLYGAAKLLNLEAMKQLKAQGVKRYDFVGVRIKNSTPELEGVFRFKKGFGGDLKTGYLWKKDILPAKAGLLDAIIYLRSGGKAGKDIIDQVNELQ